MLTYLPRAKVPEARLTRQTGDYHYCRSFALRTCACDTTELSLQRYLQLSDTMQCLHSCYGSLTDPESTRPNKGKRRSKAIAITPLPQNLCNCTPMQSARPAWTSFRTHCSRCMETVACNLTRTANVNAAAVEHRAAQ